MSRGIRILIGVAAVAYIAALVLVVYTLAEQQSADTRLTRQEKFDPCVSLSEAVANKAADRIRPLTRECREFLNGIGPLVTIKLSCAIIEKARYVCPAPGTEGHRTTSHDGAVPLGPTLTADPSKPKTERQGGGKQENPGSTQPKEHGPNHQPPKQPPGAAPLAPAAPPPESSPSSPEQPGNSGNGASSEHGVSACVDLAVSACVKTELP